MKKSFRRYAAAVLPVLILFFLLMMTACGSTEDWDTQMGIDGYVYASRIIQRSLSDQTAAGGNNYVLSANASEYNMFVAAGNYLYYRRESYADADIRRLSISGDKDPELGSGEFLFQVSNMSFSLPEKEIGLGEETALSELLKGAGREGGSMEGSVAIPSGCTHYYFFLEDYAVDSEQVIYSMERLYTGTLEEMEENGGLLCRRNPDGKVIWQKYLPVSGELAVNREGNIFILTGNEIFVYNGEGQQIDKIDLEEYQGGVPIGTLIQAEGYVYLCLQQDSLQLTEKRFYEIQQNNSLLEMKELTGDKYEYVFASLGGNLLLAHKYDGCVYEYDRKSGRVQALLRWEDSDLIRDKVRELVRINDDILLANHRGTICLLEKTLIEELPEREMIVLASLNPNDDLRNAVIEFNRNSNKYHVMIEEYGAAEDSTAALTRLDSKLASSNPPDLLDMAELDIDKYARQEILEDLNGLLEESTVLKREDFLENVLEGYTIGGKLLCIPRQYAGGCIEGRASQLGKCGEWSMEDVYAFTEKYPDAELLLGRDRNYLLEFFCAPYYLKEFVDWEAGSCSFAREEFYQLLEWTAGYQGREAEVNSSIPEDVLLNDDGLRFENVCRSELQFGEEICLVGIPDAGGACLYHVLDAIGLVGKGLHKEGAAAFLEYYLSRPWDIWSGGNTTRRDFLLEMAQRAARSSLLVYDSNGEPKKDMAGNLITLEPTIYFNIDGERIPYEQTPQRLVEQLVALIEKTDFTPRSQTEKEIIKIVMEEAAAYYNGDKSAEETAAVIQRRAELVLKERE